MVIQTTEEGQMLKRPCNSAGKERRWNISLYKLVERGQGWDI